jgi:hypothetical protein
MKREMLRNRTSWAASTAFVISKLTNPCVLSILVLLLIVYGELNNLWTLLGLMAILLFFLGVLPFIYVYLRARMYKKGTSRLTDPPLFLRCHPKDICILGAIAGLPCIVVLAFFNAPSSLLYVLIALLATSFLAAFLNMFYRASYHMAAVTILVVMTALIWKPAVLTLLAALPVIGWAKYRLGEHTPAELVRGFGLAVAVGAAAWYLLG